jgi:anti-sigma B factor antagonist
MFLRPGPRPRQEVTALPSEEGLLAQGHDEQVVITLPEEIDVANSDCVREALLTVISRRPMTVVADMTATIFCDSSAIQAILIAHRQAVADGVDLRLVICHPVPRRIFQLSGADTFIGIYPDVPAALSG